MNLRKSVIVAASLMLTLGSAALAQQSPLDTDNGGPPRGRDAEPPYNRVVPGDTFGSAPAARRAPLARPDVDFNTGAAGRIRQNEDHDSNGVNAN